MRWRWFLLPLLVGSLAWAQDNDEDEPEEDAPPTKFKAAKTADKVDARDALPPTVTVTLSTTPAVAANVYHGKQLLCTTPCNISRKRDSGPMDIVFRAGGYLPLHTRAFTFKDDKVVARMVAYGDESKLLGYKVPLEETLDEEAPPPDTAPIPSPTPVAPAPAAPAAP